MFHTCDLYHFIKVKKCKDFVTKMDADCLLQLRQGNHTIANYVEKFCVLSDKVGFGDIAFKDIFSFGLSEPVRSMMPNRSIN